MENGTEHQQFKKRAKFISKREDSFEKLSVPSWGSLPQQEAEHRGASHTQLQEHLEGGPTAPALLSPPSVTALSPWQRQWGKSPGKCQEGNITACLLQTALSLAKELRDGRQEKRSGMRGRQPHGRHPPVAPLPALHSFPALFASPSCILPPSCCQSLQSRAVRSARLVTTRENRKSHLRNDSTSPCFSSFPSSTTWGCTHTRGGCESLMQSSDGQGVRMQIGLTYLQRRKSEEWRKTGPERGAHRPSGLGGEAGNLGCWGEAVRGEESRGRDAGGWGVGYGVPGR